MTRGNVRRLPLSLAVILAAAQGVAIGACTSSNGSEDSDAGGDGADGGAGDDGGDGGGGDDGGDDGGDGDGADPPPGTVTIALAGDAMLGRNISDLLGEDPQFEIWRDLDPWLADVDILAINLETTITDSTSAWPDKAYNFKLDPDNAAAALDSLPLPEGARRYASFANNHTLDYDVEGMLDTVGHLDGLGIAHAGAGEDGDAARRPAVVETAAGVRVGFLSASTHCGCNDVDAWAAGADKPGMWYVDGNDGEWDAVLDAVEALRGDVDHVVLSIHWGPNYRDDPPPNWMADAAADLVDAGVDVIHGHSSHHVTPIEQIAGKTVAYGPGDFIDDYAPVEPYRNDLSFLTRVHLEPDGSQSFEIVPLRIHHGGGHYVQPLDPDDPDYTLVYEDAGVPPP